MAMVLPASTLKLRLLIAGLIIEMGGEIGSGIYKQNLQDIVDRLKLYNVQFLVNKKLIKIDSEKAFFEDQVYNSTISISYNDIVMAIGVRSNNSFADILKKEFDNVQIIGDASKPGRVFDALHDAYNMCKSL